jgi:hypothetical protein
LFSNKIQVENFQDDLKRVTRVEPGWASHSSVGCVTDEYCFIEGNISRYDDLPSYRIP